MAWDYACDCMLAWGLVQRHRGRDMGTREPAILIVVVITPPILLHITETCHKLQYYISLILCKTTMVYIVLAVYFYQYHIRCPYFTVGLKTWACLHMTYVLNRNVWNCTRDRALPSIITWHITYMCTKVQYLLPIPHTVPIRYFHTTKGTEPTLSKL
jgi:hypothetical protein